MLDQMMKSLAATLGVEDFIASSNGSYDIEVDQMLLNIRQQSSWLVWETALPFRFEQHLNYQQEQALKHCMQLSLKTLRNAQSTLTVEHNNQLMVQGKMSMANASQEDFYTQLSQHVNLVAQFSDLLEHQNVNQSVNHRVWIP